MRDPYEVLGVAKNASAKDIKSAYRKLAKKHHPDQNPDDPKAKDRFAAANQAYEILGDEKSRAAFDRGEIDAEGKPRFQGFEGAPRRRSVRRLPPRSRPGPGGTRFEFRSGGGDPFGGGAGDIFSEIFGQAFSQRPGRAGGRARRRAGARRQRHARRHRRGGRDRAEGHRHVPRRPQDRGQAAGLCRGRPDDPAEGAGRAGARRSRATRWSRSASAGIRATASRAATCMPTCRCR